MIRGSIVIAASAAALLLSGCSKPGDPALAIGDTRPTLPAPQQYLLPPIKIAPATGWHAGESPTVAPGLKVAALATELMHPRQPYALPNGDILVVESNAPEGLDPITRPKQIVMGWLMGAAGASAKGGNRVTLLRDANGDGTPEGRSVLLDHLYSPFGIAVIGSYLYIANTDAVVRYPYVVGQTKISAPGVKLLDLPGGPIDHHWTKSMVASADGTKLYVGVGSNSNIVENGIGAEMGRAAIWEIDVATGASRVFADGLRNPNGLTWNPASGALWTVVNERDELGPDLVPDYMTSVRDGGFYGWPYSYWGQHVDPRVMPQRPDKVAKAIVPDYSLGSHVAPLGLAFYSGGGLPARFQGGAFVGEHGSWDRGTLNGYRVVFVPFAGGKPQGRAQDVLTGFIGADKKARGRPVGLAVDRTGALLVADDLGNTVWRVTAAR